MSPKEKASFFLYSNGYSPALITLGTLVYGNYANPDRRCVSFPKIEANDLVSQGLASMTISTGCWTTTKSSTYGLGVQALDLVSVTSTYAKSQQKIVAAERCRRITLNDPDEFFETQVLPHPNIQKKLAIWLTAAKGSYLLKKATFQKPKVYCVTGLYELSGARVWIKSGTEIVGDVEVSPEVIGAATTIPIGLQIGPFSDGRSLKATIAMEETGIWAARFHQLDVGYIRSALEGRASILGAIKLRPDVTDPSSGLMAGQGADDESSDDKELEGLDVRSAMAVRLRIGDLVEEMEEEYEDDNEYNLAFDVAESRIEEDAALSDEDDE